MIGAGSLRTPFAVLAAAACVTGVALTVSDQARSVVDMAPVGVWFANDDADSVSHVGPAGTDVTVQIVKPSGALTITELDGVAYVTDEDGHLSRIDPAQLVVSQETTLPSSNSQLIGGGGRLYVVDNATGTVRELDPGGLTSIGQTDPLGELLGTAVVDDDGVLWIPDLTTGTVMAVDGRTVASTTQVASPGDDVRLSVVNGIVVAINTSASTVTQIAGGDRTGTTHALSVAPGATAPVAVGGGWVLPVVSGAELVTLDLRNGRSIRIVLAEPDHRLGTPALAGGRVYVPDFTAGTLLVVDLASERVVETLRVTGSAGNFDLVVKNGRVFVNDPASERAWTINTAGALVPVVKYDPSRPGGGSGGGVVPPPATTTTTVPRPDDRDDDDPQNDDNDDDDERDAAPPATTPRSDVTATTVPAATPVTVPVATSPPVIVIPPSTGGTAPPTVTVPGAGTPGSGTPPATTTPAPTVSNGAVRDVVAVAGDGRATVSWQPPQGWRPVTGYGVVVSPTGAAYDVSGSETSFTVSGLRNGTAYEFVITARSAAGDGAAVRSAPVTPAAPRPDAPAGVAAVAGNGQVILTWDAPRQGRVSAYVVEVLGGPGLPPSQVPGDQRQVTITGLENGTTYYATVRASTDGQTGTAASSANFVPAGPPGRPGAVSAAVTAGGQVTVTWTAAASNGRELTAYTVTGSGLAAQQVPGDRLQAVFSGLSVGSTHTFTVVATNPLGDGPGAASAAVVVQSQVPGAPGGVNATAGDASVTVTWAAAPANGSTLSGYRIRNVTAGTAATVVPAGQLSQTFGSLSNGTPYTFEVQAVATNGAAGPAVTTTAVTPIGPMVAPTNVVAVATTPGSILVTFDAPATINGNPIAHWVVSTTPSTSEQTVTSGSATITGLAQGTSYTVNVAAVAAVAGRGPAAVSAPVTTPFGTPDAVTNLDVVFANLNRVTLSWDAMPFAEWYVVEPLGGGNTAPITVTTNAVTYDPQSFFEDAWVVRVTAHSQYGASAPTQIWVFMPPYPVEECGGRTGRICP